MVIYLVKGKQGAEVESSNRIIEDEFYKVEEFKAEEDFFEKVLINIRILL